MAKQTTKPPASEASEKHDAAPPVDKAAPPARPARKPKGETCRVRLLVSRTKYGRAGTIVEHYPTADAVRHSAPPFSSVEILDDPE